MSLFGSQKGTQIAAKNPALGCLGPAGWSMRIWKFFDEYGLMVRAEPLQYSIIVWRIITQTESATDTLPLGEL